MEFKDKAADFRRKELAQRQFNQLMGMVEGILADGRINQAEVEYLHKFLVRTQNYPSPEAIHLVQLTTSILEDGVVDEDEIKELFDYIKSLVGDDSVLGELATPSNLPLCDPQPEVTFEGKHFCFTGTFKFGDRKTCVAAVKQVNGYSDNRITRKTDFLVIGTYVTESWKHEKIGTKILQSVEYRKKFGIPKIISESHWHEQLKLMV